MKTESKQVTKKAADPQQSHASKLDQIKTGKKNVRTTGGSEQKKIVITGKDYANSNESLKFDLESSRIYYSFSNLPVAYDLTHGTSFVD